MNALIFTFDIHIAKLEPSTITVPDDYPSIQEAINNADNGDTILVKNGTYHESIIVNKTVSIIGESKETTIVNASGFYDGISITADNVTVRELTVRNAAFRGIRIKSSRCYISNSNIIENNEGIFLDGREPEVTVRNNTIIENSILRNSDIGISLWASCHNQILHNTVKDNDFLGIFLYSNASNNTIKRNEIRNNGDVGILLDLDCSHNILINNNISYNGFLFIAWWSGVVLNTRCHENQMLGNKICDNKRGFFQRYSCNNNIICHNNFINNLEQVYSENPQCMNIWDYGYPSGGNHWSDYNGTDSYKGIHQNETGSDGLGDTPNVLDADNQDNYPLMNYYISDVAVIDIILSHSVVGQGHSAYVNVTLANEGSYLETLNVTLHANLTLIQTRTITLPSENYTTVTFLYDTQGFAKGNYTLRVNATITVIPSETDLTDNTLKDAWIIIAMIGDIIGIDDWPDGKCDMRDVGLVARYFGQTIPPAPPNCDLSGPINGVPDGIIDMRDIGLVARHFGETDP
jgi:parallel beta-helix repeat protein